MLVERGRQMPNAVRKNWNMQIIFTNYGQSATLLLIPQSCSTSKIVFLRLIFFLQLPFPSNNQILANNHPEDSGKSYLKCRNVIIKKCVKILPFR